MTDRQDERDLLERELADRFATMRREDGAASPAFPHVHELTARTSVVAAGHGGLAWKFTGVAAGLAAVAMMLVYQAPDDPGELYVDIMAVNAVATDQLLMASPGALPGMTELPEVYEIGVPSGQPQSVN